MQQVPQIDLNQAQPAPFMLLPKGYKTPLNPQTWLNAQAINTTTCGGYSELNIAQMANGNILSTWTTGDPTGPGSPDEVDIPGQWFNPMGAKIGTEFVVNRASTTDHEGNGDIVALPGGGLIIVYHDVNTGFAGGSNIRLEEFNAAGVRVSDAPLVVNDTEFPNFPNYANPRCAAANNISAMIVHDKIENGSTSVFAKIYNPSTNTYGSRFFVPSGTIAHRGNIDALKNGNYIVVANTNSADDRLVYQIVKASGASVTGAASVTDTNINTYSDSEAAVTTLTRGWFCYCLHLHGCD